ncbi:chemotaxis protein [Pandoraea anapnoica]|uniref:Chemotaxis protein n=2 Tax=Pandoraea anapnoica TaxID=2508301 RepID=A0A5E4ZV89_9BURK|nr:chemotaxis protein [Pandoraea anapnoica]
MDQVTSHNAALVEDAGKAAKMLEQQAQLLALSVGRFQLEAAYANGSDSENDAYPALTRPSALP